MVLTWPRRNDLDIMAHHTKMFVQINDNVTYATRELEHIVRTDNTNFHVTIIPYLPLRVFNRRSRAGGIIIDAADSSLITVGAWFGNWAVYVLTDL